MREIPLVHTTGIISVENTKEILGTEEDITIKGDLGLQIAIDGRIWICVNGIAFLRFRPT